MEILDAIYEDRTQRPQLIDGLLTTQDDDFSQYALGALVEVYAQHGDRDGLVALLSKYCPDCVALHDTTEGYLVICYKTLGVAVLFDAFERSTDERARTSIAAVLRRGFGPLGIAAEDDAEFVEKCKEWYDQNRNDYQPNNDYAHKLMNPGFDDEPLFVKRSNSAANQNSE